MDKLILVGGDEFREECIAMDTYLLEKVDKPKPKVAIIPTAAANQQPQKAADNGVRYFNSLGADAEPIMVLNREDTENITYLKNISEMDLIYFTGGDPQHLLNSLNQTVFMKEVVSSVSKGAFLVGSSAGAMIFGSRMRYKKWMLGIGLISNTAILPHHEKSDPHRVLSEIHDELATGTRIIGIDSATGVFIEDGEIEILGKGRAIFYSENDYKIIRSKS
ncbi:Type 1 glutamine amidotransferase-like domain-containing protein [Chloroflexi bacterium]|nr:Type 1 glutamine amidotransferase-like domain-containing protein [Chloroflexota bacterium]